MCSISQYRKEHEDALIALLKAEPDWSPFTSDGAIAAFKKALLESETYVCIRHGEICGYLRALVDGFGVYVSELYVAPPHRANGYGRKLLVEVKQMNPDVGVYVLSDEDAYYEKLGFKRIGSIYQL